MVSANSLNLDILEHICLFLSSNDLVSVALVNSSFFGGVVPRLYRTLFFRTSNAKRYPSVSTSFSALVAHPGLAVYVRNIDIRAIPSYKGQPHPEFMRECTQAIELCNNLCSFVYCATSSMNVLLPALQGKTRLHDIRIKCQFTADNAESLASFGNVERVALDWASRQVLSVLPDWAGRIQKSLTCLSLYMSTDLNFEVLEQTLKQLPRLLSLHIIGCSPINYPQVLSLASHTSRLESLAFTVNKTSSTANFPNPYLPRLKHLALDVRSSPTIESLSAILMSIQSSFPTLTSVALKLPDLKADDVHAFIKKVIAGDAPSLKRLALVDVSVEMRTIKIICERCQNLEVLQLPLPLKDMISFANALALSRRMHTLIDGDAHVTHGLRPYLNRSKATYLMFSVRKLKRIFSEKRVWTSERDGQDQPRVTFERHTTGASTYWFMPPSSFLT